MPPAKMPLPRNPYTDSEDGWKTTEEDGDDLAPHPAPNASVVADTPGHFNGRSHETPVNGACGAHALLEALRHLETTRGYGLVVPATAQELREALVDDIAENLDFTGVQFWHSTTKRRRSAPPPRVCFNFASPSRISRQFAALHRLPT